MVRGQLHQPLVYAHSARRVFILPFFFGGGAESLMITNQAFCQLSYTSSPEGVRFRDED
jgi:hypothetical protein